MADHDWATFLKQWSAEILRCRDVAVQFPPEIRAARWLGYPPAGEDQIALAEARLGRRLSPSYRSFLGLTDGWPVSGLFVQRLCSLAEVDWYALRYRDDLEAWLRGSRPPDRQTAPVPDEDYFVYGPEQKPESARREYLGSALAISEYWDGIYLLNPQVVSADGEWEAWFFAPWLPGAARYRSFWELMQSERQSFLEIRKQEPDDGVMKDAIPSEWP